MNEMKTTTIELPAEAREQMDDLKTRLDITSDEGLLGVAFSCLQAWFERDPATLEKLKVALKEEGVL